MEMTKRKLHIGDRFLSFTVDNENYCMDILSVKELMRMTSITPLPKMPSFIQGVINLRGQIIPIIDLRLKFGLSFQEYTNRTCIIVVEITFCEENMLMGLVVDSIQKVINIPDNKLSKIPYFNSKIKSEYIKGIADTSEGMKIVLDVLNILNDKELTAVAGTAEVQNNV